jgi:acyl carrier protein
VPFQTTNPLAIRKPTLKTTKKPMNDNAPILLQLKRLLHEQFSLDPQSLSDTTRLGEFGIDSLHLVNVLLNVETEMGVTFENFSLPPNPSLAEICEEIARASVKAH